MGFETYDPPLSPESRAGRRGRYPRGGRDVNVAPTGVDHEVAQREVGVLGILKCIATSCN